MRSLWLLWIPFQHFTIYAILILVNSYSSTVHCIISSTPKWGDWWSAIRVYTFCDINEIKYSEFYRQVKAAIKMKFIEEIFISSSISTQHCPSRVENKFIAQCSSSRHVTFHSFTYDYIFLVGFHLPSYTRMFESLILSKNASAHIRNSYRIQIWFKMNEHSGKKMSGKKNRRRVQRQ